MPQFWKPAQKDKGIQPYESRSGGFRIDENKVEYYLSPDQLAEYNRLNDTIDDDQEFWDAWSAMRVRLNLKPYTRVYTYDEKDWKGNDWWSKSKTSTKDWWGSSYTKGMSWASNKSQKMAIALQHVLGIVRTIDDNVPPMSVHWTRDNEDLSFTDLKDKAINISAEPVNNDKVTDAEAMEVVTGYALHEASHALYTAPIADTLYEPDRIHPTEIAGMLANILEDPRVEGLTKKEYPGFAEYIDIALDYSWNRRPTAANPAVYGTLGQKLNAVIVTCRWAKNIRTKEWMNDASEKGVKSLVMEDASFDAEIPWWTDWLNDYMDGKTPFRDSVQKAIEHLMDEEMEQRIEQSKARGEAADELGQLLDALMKELGLSSPCSMATGDPTKDGISAPEEEQVGKLVESKTKEVHAPDGDHDPRTMYHSRPLETADSQAYGRRKMSPIMHRLKEAIRLRPELPQFEERMLRQGELDEEELYRFGASDYRIFEQRVTQEHPQAAVTLLCDMSGSMMSDTDDGTAKITVVWELATLFVDALRSIEGVSPKVMGHTGDVTTGGEIQLYELWTRGDPLVRLGLIESLPHCNNYDGHAISWCIKDLIERAQPGDQRVLIVLSDGQPAGSGYGGMSGMQHVRKVTDLAEQKGVSVIQIAIDSDLSPEHQSQMFKHWVPFTTMATLPMAFEKVLARAINA